MVSELFDSSDRFKRNFGVMTWQEGQVHDRLVSERKVATLEPLGVMVTGYRRERRFATLEPLGVLVSSFGRNRLVSV